MEFKKNTIKNSNVSEKVKPNYTTNTTIISKEKNFNENPQKVREYLGLNQNKNLYLFGKNIYQNIYQNIINNKDNLCTKKLNIYELINN
jgi:hypothetical protein